MLYIKMNPEIQKYIQEYVDKMQASFLINQREKA